MAIGLDKKTNLLLGIFIAAIISANLVGVKIASFGLFEASDGILSFPITFLIINIIQEVHGRKKAQEFVYIGFVVLIFVLALVYISVLLPAASRYPYGNEYNTIFGTSMRIIIASIIAFFVAQMNDVWIFGLFKNVSQGRFLWLRNNVATITGQFIDTTIFIFIAFYALTDQFTAGYVFFSLALPYFFIKVIFSVLQTPLCYAGVWWLRRSEPSAHTLEKAAEQRRKGREAKRQEQLQKEAALKAMKKGAGLGKGAEKGEGEFEEGEEKGAEGEEEMKEEGEGQEAEGGAEEEKAPEQEWVEEAEEDAKAREERAIKRQAVRSEVQPKAKPKKK